MRNTLSEVTRYCREANTFGALLLCGEWGSGKTYLLEHDLPLQLGDDYVLLRISLFGEDSVESVRRKVQREYLHALLRIAPEGCEDPENGWVYRLGEDSAMSSVYGQNPSAFIRPQTTVAGKKLILIFDDLERTDLSQVEILGCINEYCENLRIKTIIVANEEKLEDLNTRKVEEKVQTGREFLMYSEMKEKLIVRTVRMKMDPAIVIASIVSGYRTSEKGYPAFLEESRDALISLLMDCEVKNIRSLRCGVQDFERIFAMCRSEGLTDGETRMIFTSFVLFTILAKAGKISKSTLYGYELNKLQQKYPGHYTERYLPACLKDGILTGEWKSAKIREQLQSIHAFHTGTMKPEMLLRSQDLMEMDDAIVRAGWHSYLQMAYEGELSPQEYIRFLRNQITARTYAYIWPEKPDLKRIAAGVELSFRALCAADSVPEQLNFRLEEEELDDCTKTETDIYLRLTDWMDSGAYLCGVNRTRILTALRNRDPRELFRCRRFEIDRFDDEMAEETMAYYRSLTTNQQRLECSDTILRILDSCRFREFGAETETLDGIRSLKQGLEQFIEKAGDAPLTIIVVRSFLKRMEKLSF